jgi:hypothetical protein
VPLLTTLGTLRFTGGDAWPAARDVTFTVLLFGNVGKAPLLDFLVSMVYI